MDDKVTARDYFAARAPGLTGDNMAALMGWPLDLPIGDYDDDEFVDSVNARWKKMTPREKAAAEATWAYIYADKMMYERGGADLAEVFRDLSKSCKWMHRFISKSLDGQEISEMLRDKLRAVAVAIEKSEGFK